MRKPLVVVCVGASAVLLAGAIAATTAGAGTTPDAPAAPSLAVPALPAAPATPATPARPAAPAHEPPAAGPGTPAVSSPGVPGLPAAPAADEEPADPPRRPGGGATPSATRPAPSGDGSRPATPSRPAPQRDVAPAADGPGSAVQQRALALVNENRRRGGCGDVTVDRRLIEAAHAHAADMARRGYFAHRSPGGADAGDRVRDAGYRWSRYGENIARGQDGVDEVVEGWMNSPSHRENILDCDLHEMGVGLAYASDRTPYWVQNFATPQ